MKEIHTDKIIETIEQLCIDACLVPSDDAVKALQSAEKEEISILAREVLAELNKNVSIAKELRIPSCQDTGMAVIFLKIGQDLHITGGNLYGAVNEGVRRGYAKGFFRKSVLSPIERKNTGDNTPAVIHTEICDGDLLNITLMPKGFGSENMSRLKMLTPAEGLDGIRNFVLETVNLAAGNPCPPIIVGAGIGGTMEKAALLAKKALLREIGSTNPDTFLAEIENELLESINKTGIGPQGLGGLTTALAVHIETFPTHIAGLPVAVNIQCHAVRHSQAIL